MEIKIKYEDGKKITTIKYPDEKYGFIKRKNRVRLIIEDVKEKGC